MVKMFLPRRLVVLWSPVAYSSRPGEERIARSFFFPGWPIRYGIWRAIYHRLCVAKSKTWQCPSFSRPCGWPWLLMSLTTPFAYHKCCNIGFMTVGFILTSSTPLCWCHCACSWSHRWTSSPEKYSASLPTTGTLSLDFAFWFCIKNHVSLFNFFIFDTVNSYLSKFGAVFVGHERQKYSMKVLFFLEKELHAYSVFAFHRHSHLILRLCTLGPWSSDSNVRFARKDYEHCMMQRWPCVSKWHWITLCNSWTLESCRNMVQQMNN